MKRDFLVEKLVDDYINDRGGVTLDLCYNIMNNYNLTREEVKKGVREFLWGKYGSNKAPVIIQEEVLEQYLVKTVGENEYTPGQITNLKSNEVFVFGSVTGGYNEYLDSIAKNAIMHFGAVSGVTRGLCGKSYAIPMFDLKTKKRIIDEALVIELSNLFVFAEFQRHLKFYVPKIGVGKNKDWGRTEAEMRNIFQEAITYFGRLPLNVILPKEFFKSK